MFGRIPNLLEKLPSFLTAPNTSLYLKDDYVVLDFETTNLDKGSPYNKDNKLVLSCWTVVKNGTITKRKSYENEFNLEELVNDVNCAEFLVAHNAKFELSWLERCGYKVSQKPVWCTQVAEHVISGNRQWRVGLNECCARRGWESKEDLVSRMIKSGVCPSTIPRKWLLKYCEKDVELCQRLFLHQRDFIFKHGLENVTYCRMLLTPVLADIERFGMMLDADRVSFLFETYTAKLHKLESQFAAMTGGINAGSGQQMAEYLFEMLGFPIPKDYRGEEMRTPTGRPKTDTDAISALRPRNKAQRDFLALYKEISKTSDLLSKYLTKMQQCCDENKGLLRASLNQTRTQSHRLSSTGGNYSIQFQNIQRELKGVIKARKFEWKVGECDYCLHPDTKVLTNDFIYKEIKHIRAGDVLVGFEEEIKLRNSQKFKKSVVEGVRVLVKPSCRIVFEDGGSVICSWDHTWVAREGKTKGTNRWTRADELSPGSVIPQVLEVWEDKSQTADGAWVSGFLDGGGWITKASSFGVGQNVDEDHNVIWNKLIPILSEDFPDLRYSVSKSSKVTRVMGAGLRSAWKLVGVYQPVRLKKKLQETYEGTILRSKRNKQRVVVDVIDLGMQEVVAVQTSTKTFIAEGLPSHNCQLEYRAAVDMAGDVNGLLDIKNKVDAHAFTAGVIFDEWNDPDIDEATKKRVRTAAKSRTFKPLYGGSSGTPREQQYYRAFKDKHREIAKWQQDNIAKVLQTKQLRIPSGLVFYWPTTKITHSGYVVNTASICNYPVQSFATADIVPLGLVWSWHLIQAAELESFIINTVHDSIIGEIHPDEIDIYTELTSYGMIDGVLKTLKDLYQYNFTTPLEVESEVYDHWADSGSWYESFQ